MQHGDHDEHGLCNKGLKPTAGVGRAAKQSAYFPPTNGYSRFASSYLERYQHNARPLWSVWWPRMLPRKNLRPSGSL